MSPHTQENLYDWHLHPRQKKESWRETIFTGLLLILALALIVFFFSMMLSQAAKNI